MRIENIFAGNFRLWGAAGNALLLLLSFICALIIQGAMPFLAMPTLGQALSTLGYSESFVNNGWFALWATHFGYPEPAAKSFGLAGAFIAAVFRRLGAHPADAYSLMAVALLAVAFMGAWKIARRYGATPAFSSLAALLWLSMPIVWKHANYSLLSIGIALLPFYFYTLIYLLDSADTSKRSVIIAFCLYPAATILSVFMDGYSFMMFAVGGSLTIGCVFLLEPGKRLFVLRGALPVHIASFFAAYILYVLYIGKSDYSFSGIDFFRGWGADITFWLAPSNGIHWLWDTMGLSVTRKGSQQFGDASVWVTTFCLPLIVVGLWSWWLMRGRRRIATAFLLTGLFGFYMAMGPSIKINSKKPADVAGSTMKAEYAVFPTGSAVISETLPGFSSMRAAYRWTALGVLCFWLLFILLIADSKSQSSKLGFALLIGALIISNLPHMKTKIMRDIGHRDDFFDIDNKLVRDLDDALDDNDLVAFLPYGNDVFVNYLAPAVGVRTYNIGGDKNLFEARRYWPPVMRGFKFGVVDSHFSERIVMLLASGKADVVVLPYIDLLWAAHDWADAPTLREELEPVIHRLSAERFIQVDERKLYAVVRLDDSFDKEMQQETERFSFYRDHCVVPYCLEYSGNKSLPSLVGMRVESGMSTDGREGYLLYGPYSSLKAGTYKLVLRGQLKELGAGVVVDVVQVESGAVYGRYAGIEAEGDVLLQKKLVIGKDAESIEIRVHVSSDTDLLVSGYKLFPVADIEGAKE